ncbi:MAG TPA: hypothetical protein VFI27_06435 [candidate division Zixibacteria bacterium]|nr:hypothetical protein [candidate division Zixibacteria bacterium]
MVLIIRQGRKFGLSGLEQDAITQAVALFALVTHGSRQKENSTHARII